MTEITFNDGRKPRGYTDTLFVGVDDQVHKFAGATIPGVAAVAGRQHEKNGKWSNTTYAINLATGGWSLVLVNDWDSGEKLHGCRSVADAVAVFRGAGCAAPEAVIITCLDEHMKNTVARIRATEAEINSVS